MSTVTTHLVLQIVKPLAPFFVAAAITWYGVNVAQTAGVNSEYRSDGCGPFVRGTLS